MLRAFAAALAVFEAAAPSFSQTFTTEAAATYLDSAKAALVVGAGPSSDALSQATASLEGALRTSGKLDLVLNGKTLGEVGSLDDQAIVKKCAALPIERVVIVRVFESPGKPARAVATLYDMKGSMTTAFTGVAGAALAAKGGPAENAPPSSGLSHSAAQAVLETGPDKATSTSQQQYDEQYIGFTDFAVLYQTGLVATWSKPFLGKYQKPLDFEDFYTRVERPDLASSYQTRKWVRIGLWGGSIAVTTATLIAVLASVDNERCNALSADFSACMDRQSKGTSSSASIGLVGLGIGTVLAVVPLFINPQPIEAADARRLADEHNQKLKSKLGIAQAESPSRSANQEPSLTLSVDFFGTTGGGGLALRGSF